jgi:hypothetical protein
MSTREPRTIRIAEDRWATVRHVVEAVAIVAAGVWAFYTFIYQERIKPAGEAAALVPTVSIERLGRDAQRDVLRINVRLHNTGHSVIDIAADAWNVWGQRYGTTSIAGGRESPQRRTYGYLVPRTSSRLIATFGELRDAARDGVAGNHIIIEPGADNVISDVIVVPRGAYDVLRAQAVAITVKVSLGRKIPVKMLRLRDGSTWFDSPDAESWEDDSEVQYALIP